MLLDLPGHGGGQGPDAATLTLAGTLERIESAGAWPTDLIGYSMGGRLALHFAATRPGLVRRLVLESASPGLPTDEERSRRRAADEALAARIERDFEGFLDEWSAQPLFESQAKLSAATRARVHRIRGLNDPAGVAAALRALGTGALPSLWDRLPAVHVPTLLLVGEADTKFVDINQRMADALPDARLVVVADAGHTVHLERPGAWLDAVRRFLSESRTA